MKIEGAAGEGTAVGGGGWICCYRGYMLKSIGTAMLVLCSGCTLWSVIHYHCYCINRLIYLIIVILSQLILAAPLLVCFLKNNTYVLCYIEVN